MLSIMSRHYTKDDLRESFMSAPIQTLFTGSSVVNSQMFSQELLAAIQADEIDEEIIWEETLALLVALESTCTDETIVEELALLIDGRGSFIENQVEIGRLLAEVKENDWKLAIRDLRRGKIKTLTVFSRPGEVKSYAFSVLSPDKIQENVKRAKTDQGLNLWINFTGDRANSLKTQVLIDINEITQRLYVKLNNGLERGSKYNVDAIYSAKEFLTDILKAAYSNKKYGVKDGHVLELIKKFEMIISKSQSPDDILKFDKLWYPRGGKRNHVN